MSEVEFSFYCLTPFDQPPPPHSSPLPARPAGGEGGRAKEGDELKASHLAPLPPWGFGPAAAIPGAVEPIFPSLPLPRKDRERIVQIYLAQRHFFPGKGRKPQVFMRKPYFHEAWQLFKLTAEAEGQMDDLVKQWESLLQGMPEAAAPVSKKESSEGGRKRRRRRRRKPRLPPSPNIPA